METTLTSTTPPPSKPENLLDMVFSYDNTIMLASIISLLIVILFVLLLHLYARWFLTHHNNLPPLRRHHLSTTFTTYEISPAPKEPGIDGLDSFIIESIPTFVCNKDTPTMECAICLSEFEEDEVGRTLPRCSHAFHVECIDTWLRDHSTCPVCRLGLVGDLCKDGYCKDDVVLEIDDSESDSVRSSSENVSFERLMRTAVSRSCRSDVVVGNRRSDRARPSI